MTLYMTARLLSGLIRTSRKYLTVAKADHFSKEFFVFQGNFDIPPKVTSFLFFDLLERLLTI